MGSLYQPRRMPSGRTCFMLVVEVVVLGLALWRLSAALLPAGDTATTSDQPAAVEFNPNQGLTRDDVLPTPTPDTTVPPRLITFPGASMSAPIIPAGRLQGTWETRHLGDSVGHLVGTSWLDDPGGNIVLAGHVENASGLPGPFAHLFEAESGDLVIVRDGLREEHFTVTSINYAESTEIGYVAQDGQRRLTLITCTDWDQGEKTYLGRLVVIAEPVAITAQSGP